MSVFLTTDLQQEHKEALLSMHPHFPIEDASFFALCELEGHIHSAAAFIKEDNLCYECYAYTRPEFRRRGHFTELLDAAIEALPEDTEFLFYTNGTDPDSMAVLNALEAEQVLYEYMMELRLEHVQKHVPEPTTHDFTVNHTIEDGTKTLLYQNPHGTVRILVFSSYYYLYGLEIQEEFRGKGCGKAFFAQVLYDLAERRPLPLRLQVSGENLPALSLYKKTGFQITETLFGYLY